MKGIPKRIDRILARILKSSRQKCHTYWANPSDEANQPQNYADDSCGIRSMFLVDMIRQYAPVSQPRIMELGSNVGRNLHYLFQGGFEQLSAIEINANAIELRWQIYPELVGNVQITNATLETALPELQAATFDVVFTMAVLQHIHPSSSWIFRYIAEITKHILITIEDERRHSCHQWPRKYESIFERLGMIQHKAIKSPANLGDAYIARVFKSRG